MNQTTQQSINIQILGKEYKIGCTEDTKQELLNATAYLDEQMRQVRENGKVIGMERIAVMVALNLSNELLNKQHEPGTVINDENEFAQRVNSKLDIALNRLKQLEI